MASPTREAWARRHRELPPLEAIGHSGVGEPFNALAYRLRRAVFLSTLRPVVAGRRLGTVLDVGSGTGFYLDLWRELGAERVVASDFVPRVVEALRGRPGVEALEFDIGGPPHALPERRFDAVSAMAVLFHVLDDRSYHQAFRNLGSLVAPGGLLVFSENFLRNAERTTLPRQVDRSERLIEALLRENGFEPLVRQRMFVLLDEPQNAGRARRAAWVRLKRAMRRHPWLGSVVGTALYPLERALVALPGPGSSTDLMVCRKND
jgi:SAM-dependent methyltransferase